MNVLDEFCLKAYECSSIYKDNMKRYHDQRIEKREFAVGDVVLLFDSRLHLFLGKLKYKWTGHSSLPKCFHIERLSRRTRKTQGSQSMDKGLSSIWGMRKVFMKWLRPTIVMNSDYSRGMRVPHP